MIWERDPASRRNTAFENVAQGIQSDGGLTIKGGLPLNLSEALEKSDA